LKARFILELRQIYPGPWEAKPVLAAIGGNLRDRRTRLKRKFEVYKNFKRVPQLDGCTKESWWNIYEETKDDKKISKSALYKLVAQKRMEEHGYTHRCGPKGLKGLRDRFVSLYLLVY
jgi:hypothetical protein